IIEKMIKQRKDSISQFEAGGRQDLADIERAELEVLSAYMPAALSEEEVQAEVRAAVASVGAAGPQDMGKVMGVLKAKLAGRADMTQVSGRVKAALSGQEFARAAARYMIPQSFLQDLLNRVDIVDIVGRYVQLKKGGANFIGLCPFHNEKAPSFTVSPTKQFYHCFGCDAHGTAITFLMEYSGHGFVDAVKDLAQNVGMTVPEEESGL